LSATAFGQRKLHGGLLTVPIRLLHAKNSTLAMVAPSAAAALALSRVNKNLKPKRWRAFWSSSG